MSPELFTTSVLLGVVHTDADLTPVKEAGFQGLLDGAKNFIRENPVAVGGGLGAVTGGGLGYALSDKQERIKNMLLGGLVGGGIGTLAGVPFAAAERSNSRREKIQQTNELLSQRDKQVAQLDAKAKKMLDAGAVTPRQVHEEIFGPNDLDAKLDYARKYREENPDLEYLQDLEKFDTPFPLSTASDYLKDENGDVQYKSVIQEDGLNPNMMGGFLSKTFRNRETDPQVIVYDNHHRSFPEVRLTEPLGTPDTFDEPLGRSTLFETINHEVRGHGPQFGRRYSNGSILAPPRTPENRIIRETTLSPRTAYLLGGSELERRIQAMKDWGQRSFNEYPNTPEKFRSLIDKASPYLNDAGSLDVLQGVQRSSLGNPSAPVSSDPLDLLDLIRSLQGEDKNRFIEYISRLAPGIVMTPTSQFTKMSTLRKRALSKHASLQDLAAYLGTEAHPMITGLLDEKLPQFNLSQYIPEGEQLGKTLLGAGGGALAGAGTSFVFPDGADDNGPYVSRNQMLRRALLGAVLGGTGGYLHKNASTDTMTDSWGEEDIPYNDENANIDLAQALTPGVPTIPNGMNPWLTGALAGTGTAGAATFLRHNLLDMPVGDSIARSLPNGLVAGLLAGLAQNSSNEEQKRLALENYMAGQQSIRKAATANFSPATAAMISGIPIFGPTMASGYINQRSPERMTFGGSAKQTLLPTLAGILGTVAGAGGGALLGRELTPDEPEAGGMGLGIAGALGGGALGKMLTTYYLAKAKKESPALGIAERRQRDEDALLKSTALSLVDPVGAAAAMKAYRPEQGVAGTALRGAINTAFPFVGGAVTSWGPTSDMHNRNRMRDAIIEAKSASAESLLAQFDQLNPTARKSIIGGLTGAGLGAVGGILGNGNVASGAGKGALLGGGLGLGMGLMAKPDMEAIGKHSGNAALSGAGGMGAVIPAASRATDGAEGSGIYTLRDYLTHGTEGFDRVLSSIAAPSAGAVIGGTVAPAIARRFNSSSPGMSAKARLIAAGLGALLGGAAGEGANRFTTNVHPGIMAKGASANSIMEFINGMNPDTRRALTGAVTGGGLGLLSSAFTGSPIRNTLLGALLGGGVGYSNVLPGIMRGVQSLFPGNQETVAQRDQQTFAAQPPPKRFMAPAPGSGHVDGPLSVTQNQPVAARKDISSTPAFTNPMEDMTPDRPTFLQ